jgi:hypothetical protein
MQRPEETRGASGAGAALGGEAARLADILLTTRRLHELPEEVFQLGAVWSACERCLGERDAVAAERLYQLLAEFAGWQVDRAGGAFWCGAAAHYLGALAGLLARWDAAAAHFEDALRAGAAGGAVLEIRHTQLAYARLLLTRGAPGDAVRAERLLAAVIAGLHPAHAGSAAPSADRRAAAPVGGGASPIGDLTAPSPLRASHPPSSRYLFRREGDYWTLACEGRVSRLRGLRGFEYIAELLRHPHQQIYVIDLAASRLAIDRRLSAQEAVEHGLRVSGEADVTPALDRRARNDYRTRWRELRVEEGEARRDNDLGRVARIQYELDMLTDQLTAAVGAHGGGRGGPSLRERARVNVRNCITGALRAVRPHDELLWRHLCNSIKTGAFCCYAPDRPVQWEM